MTQLLFSVDQIKSNPWQPRTDFDAALVAELAEDIKMRGLLQTPIARVNGHGVELAFGHRRLAAWKIAFPGEPFPLEIRELSDRDMSDFAAAENAQRRDLTAIETARAIQRRVVDFKLTQLEAAKPFGIMSQGGVSNLLRLLKLPAEVQEMVQQHKLAERNARALLVLERVAPDKTVKIAQESMSAENRDHAEEFIDDQMDRLILQKGRHLDFDAAFKLDWPKEPIPLAKPIGDLTELPACADCMWRVRVRRGEGVCVHSPCFDAKQKIGIELLVQQLAKSKGIPPAGADEKVTLLWDGGDLGNIESWNTMPHVARMVKARLPELRIVPCPDNKQGAHYREEYLGSRWVALATTNKAAVMKWVNADKEERAEKVAEVRAKERAEESEAAKRKRIEKEKREQAERRAEQSAFLKSKYDTLWLLLHVAELIEPQIEINGGILRLAEHHLVRDYGIYSRWAPMIEQSRKLANAARAEKDKDRESALMVQRIVYHVLAKEISEGNYGIEPDEKVYDFQRAVGMAKIVATQTFEVKLPPGWDKRPIHQTPINCWTCGRFAPNENGLTGRDAEEGWITVPTAKETMVFCGTEHASMYGDTAEKRASRRARRKNSHAVR